MRKRLILKRHSRLLLIKAAQSSSACSSIAVRTLTRWTRTGVAHSTTLSSKVIEEAVSNDESMEDSDDDGWDEEEEESIDGDEPR